MEYRPPHTFWKEENPEGETEPHTKSSCLPVPHILQWKFLFERRQLVTSPVLLLPTFWKTQQTPREALAGIMATTVPY